ncbi:hypothetical protein [Facklamia sp. 7083-14-GEN3]|uniref:hypothetical protein n=1 Tax=Facklamia sp. 7083-14-GEN3 TaxID=2973478 RepID=UPI00215C3934|nr:hypothetical protein [Facklamia sp. 7083-14-GEN3]MCR8968397.1 hypothetical protein [Facklamia sp. 7083-14-GEN3]
MMTGHFGQIFLLPGRSLLEKEIKRLQADLLQAVFEYDELIYKDCFYLEKHFYFNFGKEWFSLLKAHFQTIYLERKYGIMRRYKNNDQKLRLQQLEKDLSVYQQLITKTEEKIQSAELWIYEDKLTDEESRLMRGMYRQIVSNVHPLLYPLQTKNQEALYQKALTAYKRDNKEILQLVLDQLNEDYAQASPLKLSQLVDVRNTLLVSLYETRNQLAIRRSDFPYLIRNYILNDNLGEKMRQSLIHRRSQFTHKINQLELEIAKLKER